MLLHHVVIGRRRPGPEEGRVRVGYAPATSAAGPAANASRLSTGACGAAATPRSMVRNAAAMRRRRRGSRSTTGRGSARRPGRGRGRRGLAAAPLKKKTRSHRADDPPRAVAARSRKLSGADASPDLDGQGVPAARRSYPAILRIGHRFLAVRRGRLFRISCCHPSDPL